jgi:glutaredoxin
MRNLCVNQNFLFIQKFIQFTLKNLIDKVILRDYLASKRKEIVFMGVIKEFDSSPLHLSANGVVVYTTNGCTRCKMLKKWLKNKDTNFVEKDLEDSEVMTDLVMRNFVVLSAPAVEVEGTVYTENQIFESNGLISPNFSKLFGGM